MKESEIRTLLAKNLNLLDPSLSLVKEEYPIKLFDGRRGFIDILAKDKYGCYTIIEIKKSNKSARTSVQQMYKYASFFKEKNRLETSQIRLVVISTVWEELNSPFSEFKHFCDYDCLGYKLTFDAGLSPNLERVDPKFVTGNNKPLNNFIFIGYKEKQERDNQLKRLVSFVRKVPSLNSVVFSLNLSKGKEFEAEAYGLNTHQYGIAWVVFTSSSAEIDSQIELLKLEEYEMDFYLQTIENDDQEFVSRTKILSYLISSNKISGGISGYATHTLNNLDNVCDYDIEPILTGTMFEDGLYTVGEAIDMAHGINGLHPYIFIVKTTPERIVHFNTIRKDISDFLKHNKHWNESINYLLSDLDQEDEVHIQIYNPLNVFALFNDLCVAGESERIPHILAEVIKSSGEKVEYYGGLFWDNSQNLPDPVTAIEDSYKNIEIFRIRSVINTLTDKDEHLSSLCGLNYHLINLSENKYYSLEKKTWVENDDNVKFNINDFVKANGIFVVSVGELYNKLEIGIGNKTNMVVINPD